MVKKGFSLIELTVVIGLLSLLILAISSTMLMSIMSSNRVRTITKVKQAGNYAIGEIQTMLRSAKQINSCISSASSDTPSITIVNSDGGETTIIKELLSELDTNPNYHIASRSAETSGSYLTPSTVNVLAFSISCEPGDTDPTFIKVAFDLKSNLTTRATENPILHFETSINLRNE